ncbi:hypothetical protein QAD02_015096 [Eretmocerus hayati]|uniref:Uncharacterized protein n=1 Tax=Eretmocerus hayati TaxID=131215 RepID=A0ACC2P9R2_9HYME|nr:hypothetical protein QAD02_015096 [Eretmocerus hayati]
MPQSVFDESRHKNKKRSADSVLFGEEHFSYLEEEDSTLWGSETPVFLARNKGMESQSISYTHLPDIFSKKFSIHDHFKGGFSVSKNNQADVTKSHNPETNKNDRGKTQSNINQLGIHLKFPKQQRIFHLETAPSLNMKESSRHAIQKRGLTVMGYKTSAAMKKLPFIRKKRPVWCPQDPKLPFKDIVYPQLLVVVDYETYKANGYDAQSVARYMAAFWNGVDMLFRKMSKLKIRINIAGLIIPADEESVPYMNHIDVFTGRRSVTDVMVDIATYFQSHQAPFPWCSYDIVVGISHLDLYSDSHSPFGLGGAAWHGSCMNKIYSVAIVQDKGDFSGSIAAAAHELAHTMGADHDIIPGGGRCSVEGQSIMSVSLNNQNKLNWSNCSISDMHSTLSDESYSCLRNKPDVGHSIPQILPGRLYSLDEVCRKMSENPNAKAREYDCKDLWCDLGFGSSMIVGPAPEGSPCSKGGEGICIEGERKTPEENENYFENSENGVGEGSTQGTEEVAWNERESIG